jgi:hypothetical protein
LGEPLSQSGARIVVRSLDALIGMAARFLKRSSVMKETRRNPHKRRRSIPAMEAVMSQRELAMLGGGKVAYIKAMSSDEAKRMYPSIDDLPSGIQLFALQAADGTPIALTDSIQAAMGHAIGDELEVKSLH